jgi:Zn-dependent protease
MRTHIKLGRILGIEIGLHYSWLVIAGLILLSLGGHFQAVHPEWDTTVIWAASVLTTLLFFIALLLHELAHSLVAISRGLPVKSITLFALGGVSQIEKEPEDAKTEFWMAIVGPLTSAAIGGVCLGIAAALGWHAWVTPQAPVLAVLVWLGYINLLLAAFNMIPGYPLDGGRVFRAIVWWITGNGLRSTRIAAQTGRGVAWLFIGFGVFRFFVGASFGGLWLALIGWFLLQAAGSSYSQLRVAEALNGLRVRDLMIRDCPVVDSRTNVTDFVEEHLPHTSRFCYIVTENGQDIGLISPREVESVPRPQWPFKLVSDVMWPLDYSESVTPDTSVLKALEMMGREHVYQLPVAEGGRLEGIISRASVLGFLHSHGELGA